MAWPTPPPPLVAPIPPPNTTQYSSRGYKQGTLSIGSNLMTTAPDGYTAVVTLRFNNPAAYDITLSITRVASTDPDSTLQCYSLTLDAGDTLEDTGYTLFPGDSITVDTTTADTNYFMNLSYNRYSLQV